MEPVRLNDTANVLKDRADEFKKNLFQQFRLPWLDEIVTKLTTHPGKKGFLILKSNKYINVPAENIAFFYIKYESAMIMCFDKQE